MRGQLRKIESGVKVFRSPHFLSSMLIWLPYGLTIRKSPHTSIRLFKRSNRADKAKLPRTSLAISRC